MSELTFPITAVVLTSISGSPRFDRNIELQPRAAIQYDAANAMINFEIFTAEAGLAVSQIPVADLIKAAIRMNWLQSVIGCRITRQFTPPENRRPWINYEQQRRNTAGVIDLQAARLTVSPGTSLTLPVVGLLEIDIEQDQVEINGNFEPEHRLNIKLAPDKLLLALTLIGCLWPISWNGSTQQVVVRLPRCAR